MGRLELIFGLWTSILGLYDSILLTLKVSFEPLEVNLEPKVDLYIPYEPIVVVCESTFVSEVYSGSLGVQLWHLKVQFRSLGVDLDL